MKIQGRIRVALDIDHDAQEFIVYKNNLYSLIYKDCILYNNKIYYCRENAKQVRVGGRIRNNGAFKKYMKENKINILKDDIVLPFFPQNDLKRDTI